MAQIRRRIKTAIPITPFEKSLEQELLSAWLELASIINKGLTFADNFATSEHLEGDWTAAFVCGTSGTITIHNSYKTGRYVKIGKMVTVIGLFRAASVSSPVGQLMISGLPFTCGVGHKYSSATSVLAISLEVTGTTTMMAQIAEGSASIYIYHFTAGTLAVGAADVKAGSEFIISATYFTD